MRKNSPPTALLTIPNILSLLRLLAIPILVFCYIKAKTNQEYHIAGLIAVISFLTDFYDGYLARKWNCTTYIGRILDPVADKGMQFAILISLSIKESMFRPILYLLAIKETIQLLAGIYYLRKGMLLKTALPAGKTATALLFVSFFLLIVFPNMKSNTMQLIALIDFIALSASFINYSYIYCTGHGNFEELSKQ